MTPATLLRLIFPLWFLLALNVRAAEPSADYWLDLYTGEEVSPAALVDDLKTAQVIYAGEIHTLERHHQTQLFLLQSLIATGEPLALGLEQIEATDQAEVDRFNRREIDFNGLAEAIGWAKKWRNFEQYRPLCELAQANGVDVVALNAPADLVRHVGRNGLASLDEPQRGLLPKTIVTEDPGYEKLMNLLLSVHMSMDPQKLKPIFEAQVVRDEMMAQQVVASLKTPEGKPRRVLVVCGRGHISYGMGIPDRVQRRQPDVVDRIVLVSESGELKLSAEEEAMRRKITISHSDLRSLRRPLGDYLHLLPRSSR